MVFVVGEQQMFGLVECGVVLQCGQYVLQWFVFVCMYVYVVGSDQWQVVYICQCVQLFEMFCIVGIEVVFKGDLGFVRKFFCQLVFVLVGGFRVGDLQYNVVFVVLSEIVVVELVLFFFGIVVVECDQCCYVVVVVLISCQQNQFYVVV